MEASLGRGAYCDAEVFADEQERAFATSWVCVGRSDSVGSRPGSYAVVEVAGERVLIVRDNPGSLGAFANRCMHRGTELVDSTDECAALTVNRCTDRFRATVSVIGAVMLVVIVSPPRSG